MKPRIVQLLRRKLTLPQTKPGHPLPCQADEDCPLAGGCAGPTPEALMQPQTLLCQPALAALTTLQQTQGMEQPLPAVPHAVPEHSWTHSSQGHTPSDSQHDPKPTITLQLLLQPWPDSSAFSPRPEITPWTKGKLLTMV